MLRDGESEHAGENLLAGHEDEDAGATNSRTAGVGPREACFGEGHGLLRCWPPFHCFLIPGSFDGYTPFGWSEATPGEPLRDADRAKELDMVRWEKEALWERLPHASDEDVAKSWHESIVSGDVVGRCFLPAGAHCGGDAECGENLLCVPASHDHVLNRDVDCTCQTVQLTRAELVAGKMPTLYSGVCGRPPAFSNGAPIVENYFSAGRDGPDRHVSSTRQQPATATRPRRSSVGEFISRLFSCKKGECSDRQ